MYNNNCPEKDALISQLKAEIFEKEQNEKDFNLLQSKFRNLQNELQILSECKLHLEYELRTQTDCGNKNVSDLKIQNENLLNELNEKIALNKKLYNDNNNLFRALESKTAENQDLNAQVCDQENILARLCEDKNNKERELLNLNQTKAGHLNNIQNLNDQIEALSQQANEQSNLLKNKHNQNEEVKKALDATNFENENLLGKLKNKEENLYSSQQQLDIANETLGKLENDFNQLNNEYNNNKNNIANLNNGINQENTIREQIEMNNNKLESMINERNENIKKISNENDTMKMTLEKLCNDKDRICNELEMYKRHILVVMEQNDKLAKELECVLDRDMKLGLALRRSEKLKMVCAQNKQIIENSLDNLNYYLKQQGNNINNDYNINQKKTYETNPNILSGSTFEISGGLK
jgi:chromosome segregation ATPase